MSEIARELHASCLTITSKTQFQNAHAAKTLPCIWVISKEIDGIWLYSLKLSRKDAFESNRFLVHTSQVPQKRTFTYHMVQMLNYTFEWNALRNARFRSIPPFWLRKAVSVTKCFKLCRKQNFTFHMLVNPWNYPKEENRRRKCWFSSYYCPWPRKDSFTFHMP